MRTSPIGVFDSGLGGLTAVKEMLSVMPGEDILYLGDTARVPYGSRQKETIIKYAQQDLDFLIKHHPKAILIACGTVSATALPILRQKTDVPMLGVIEAAARKAAGLTKNGRILVMATNASVKSHAYRDAIAAIDSKLEVREMGCPLLVPLVENGYVQRDNTVTRLVVADYLAAAGDFAPDTVILGCTHYPLIREIIAEKLPGVEIVEAGKEAVAELREILKKSGMEAPAEQKGALRCCVTDVPDTFNYVGKLFLGQDIAGITSCVSLGQE